MSKWKIVLMQEGTKVETEGCVAEIGTSYAYQTIGYTSTGPEIDYALQEIRRYLEGEGSNLCDAELVRKDIGQMLCNETLKEWHSLRLAWGEEDPTTRFKQFPNGRDTNWTLYWCANGEKRVKLTGNLPDNWWQLTDDERWRLVDQLELAE